VRVRDSNPGTEANMQPIHPKHARAARRFQNLRRSMILAIFCLATAGCGSDSLLGPGLGNGSLTASGVVSVSGTGFAVFQSASSGGTSLFQIVIAPLTQSSTVWELQIANYSGRLAVGTYGLSPLSGSSTNPTATFFYAPGATMQLFNSTSGQLVITSSSSSEVRGTYTFTATDTSDGTRSVTVHGSFTAQCTPGAPCE
jgi:hypothetical protein